MLEPRYTTDQAVADLRAAGLLSGVLVGGADGLEAPGRTPVEVSPLPGGFLGAGLDSRSLEPGALFVALQGEHIDGRRFAAGTAARGHWVLTRHLADVDPLRGAPAPAEAGVLLSADPELALAHLARCWRMRQDVAVVGVTGTNGKTTTKDLLTALLTAAGPVHGTAGNLNNQLGVPLTLLGLRADHRHAVIEMGASAVGEIAVLAPLAAPQVGIITNAAPAHLAEFGSLDGIVTGKGELLDALPADGTAILNAESPGFNRWNRRAPCPVVSWGQETGDVRWTWQRDGVDGRSVLGLGGQSWPVPLPGIHNGANLVAALLAGKALGLDDEQLARGLAAFAGSPHRGIILDIGGRTVLDDCYNANPRSMLTASLALAELGGGGRRVAVLGHMAELGAESEQIHRETGADLARGGTVDRLVAVGEIARPLGEGFDRAGGDVHYSATCAEAADWLVDYTRPGDRILLKGSRSAAMEQLLPMLEKNFRR